jgi:serine/threonine protein kinase
VFLRRKGGAVLLDFGSAREMLAQRLKALTGMVTPGYAPIEQYSGQSPQGPWTDLYALGATLYHCLTGVAPAGAPERVAALQARERDPVDDLATAVRQPCSNDFIALVEWMLAPMPADRPQTVASVLARLAAISPHEAARGEASHAIDRTVALQETPTRPPLTPEEVEVLRSHRARAEAGEAEAQYKLGMMLAHGFGAEKNLTEAVHWLRQAAEQNHLAAQVKLGLLLARTQMPDTSPTQARDWLQKAAERRDARAMFNLGLMHAHGIGIPRDVTAARHWYKRAAALGHSGARTNLSLIEPRSGLRRLLANVLIPRGQR